MSEFRNTHKIHLCSTTNFCEINHHHTTEVKDYFVKNNYELVLSPEEATDIVVMTCGALQSSEDRSISLLEKMGVNSTDKNFYIMGCLPAINGDLPVFKNVKIIGTRDFRALEEIFPATIALSEIETNQIDYDFIHIENGISNRFTIIAVQGCLGNCTYCAIHKAKGLAKSLPMDVILSRCKNIIKNNHKPIIAFLGEDFGSYGSDIGSDPAELLKKVSEIEGDFEIEIQNFEPSRFLLFYEQLKEIFKLNIITKIHIAIQTGSQQVLARMGRRYDIDAVVERIKQASELSPSLVLETSFIINFPGETRNDFLKTLNLLPVFGEVTVFNFSPRFGTKASTMDMEILDEERQERVHMVKQLTTVHPTLVLM